MSSFAIKMWHSMIKRELWIITEIGFLHFWVLNKSTYYWKNDANTEIVSFNKTKFLSVFYYGITKKVNILTKVSLPKQKKKGLEIAFNVCSEVSEDV